MRGGESTQSGQAEVKAFTGMEAQQSIPGQFLGSLDEARNESNELLRSPLPFILTGFPLR
jgi:hypothetical protein